MRSREREGEIDRDKEPDRESERAREDKGCVFDLSLSLCLFE